MPRHSYIARNPRAATNPFRSNLLSSDNVEEMAYMRQELSDTRRILRLNAETLTALLVGLDPRHPGFRNAFSFVARDLRHVGHVLSALKDVARERERAMLPDRAVPLRAADVGCSLQERDEEGAAF